MRLVSPAEHTRMPWKNGGGVTNEIVVEPARSDRFLYRLSIADVATDGPFSRFDGYDRHIMLLGGVGMTIDAGVHGRVHLLPFAPRAFSGDWDVTGTLESGGVRDLNLIVDRARAASTLDVHRLVEKTVVRASTCLAYVLEGTLSNAHEGDTLVAEGELTLVPAPSARVVVGRVLLGSGLRRHAGAGLKFPPLGGHPRRRDSARGVFMAKAKRTTGPGGHSRPNSRQTPGVWSWRARRPPGGVRRSRRWDRRLSVWCRGGGGASKSPTV